MKKNSTKLIAELTKQLLPVCEKESVAQAESWWMLEKLTNQSQAQLISQEEIMLTSEQWDTLDSWVAQRVEEQEPLQYILGTVPFCGLEILVKPPVLIPRPETEEWCSWLIDELELAKDKKIKILDLGVGSGCIALALAKALPYATVIGVDIHSDAIRLSEKNKAHNNISNAVFIQSDLYKELLQHKNSFDLIVSNPPYIAYEEYKTLSKQVTDWEDKSALVAGEEGFSIHKKILADATKFLKQESIFVSANLPRIVVEFGKGQGKKLKELFASSGFANITIHKDLEGVERWITGS